MSTIEISSLTLVAGDKCLCRDLSFKIDGGECWALLGKNGAGKTSLIHSIAGLRNVESGSIKLNNKDILHSTSPALARELGVLFQDGLDSLPATVMETVMLGRHPHTQSLFKDNEEDLALARSALEEFALTSLDARAVDSLSGGEKQRVALAMLVTQAPNVYLLDEPSNHLDIAFQVSTLKTLHTKISDSGASMLMATHDINLASRFCEKFVLLTDDGESLCGSRDEILDKKVLSDAYGCEIETISEDGRTLFFPA